MDNDLYIYVILLEGNNYFIHHATNQSPDKIMLEFEICYDFLKIYKPICIIEIIKETDELQLDYVVKQYMYRYGYGYVRGGSYTNIELSPTESLFVERELTESVREYPNKYEHSYEYIFNNYITREWKSVEEINNEYNSLKQKFQKYQQEKLKLDALETIDYGRKIIMNNYVLCEIELLYDYCKYRSISMTNDYLWNNYDMRLKYREILPKIKHIMKTYVEKCEFPTTNLKYVKYMHIYPQFVLDPFFYTYEFSPQCDYSKLDEIFHAILFFTQWVLNRIEEERFNVNSYDYNIQWLHPRILYLLENIKKEENINILSTKMKESVLGLELD